MLHLQLTLQLSRLAIPALRKCYSTPLFGSRLVVSTISTKYYWSTSYPPRDLPPTSLPKVEYALASRTIQLLGGNPLSLPIRDSCESTHLPYTDKQVSAQELLKVLSHIEAFDIYF